MSSTLRCYKGNTAAIVGGAAAGGIIVVIIVGAAGVYIISKGRCSLVESRKLRKKLVLKQIHLLPSYVVS